MDDVVLITTSNLPLAGDLREGFRAGGYQGALITPEESIANLTDAVLLVLTADLANDHVQALARQAHHAVEPSYGLTPSSP